MRLKPRYFLVMMVLTFSALDSFPIVRAHIDLKVNKIDIDNKDPIKGDRINFSIEVEKRGSGKSDGARLVCKIRHYQVIDIPIDFRQSAVIKQAYTWKALFGTQSFKCTIDPDDEFLETDEDNNEYVINFEVKLPY